MTREQGGGGSESRTGEFGDIGTEIASYADSISSHFSVEPDWSNGDSLEWEESDYLALDALLEIEWLTPLMEISHTVDQQRRALIHQAFLLLHLALPFNEAERAWLRVARGEDSDDPETLPSTFESQEGTIMVAGIRRPVSGHNLMGRWLAWRRQTDEYQGQGSLDQARDALQSLSAQMRAEN